MLNAGTAIEQRETIGVELLRQADHLDKRSHAILASLSARLAKVARVVPSCPSSSAPTPPPVIAVWPDYFDTLRTSLMNITRAIEQLEDIEQRLEL